MSPALAVAALAAIIGPLVAYITTTRKLSGKIGTSEASELWAATKDIRDYTAEQLRIANARIQSLESLITDLRDRLERAEKENENCWNQIHALQKQTGSRGDLSDRERRR